jgi:hypothetical protein
VVDGQGDRMSQTAVSRIWRAFGRKPHLVQTWKLSTDPQVIDKVRDIVGLYLDPPQAAVVLCVDEKSQIQLHFTPTYGSWLNLVERWLRS